ncbi:MAG: 50S ribosomal protein L23 [Patescibacteria group bacterium]
MGILDFLKTDKKDQAATRAPQQPKISDAPKKDDAEKGKLLKKKAEKKEVLKASKKNTKLAYKVLLKPIITEKATQTGSYIFMIDSKSNKQEVKKAIKTVYGVTPFRVNILNVKSKKVRWGRTSGSTKKWKKAIVYLKKGETIQVFEGV